MTNTGKRKFDLEDRTTVFADRIIRFSRSVPNTLENKPVRSQLVRSGTSIGANYCEADEAESKKDFLHKLGICKKEARETKYWLRVIVTANPGLRILGEELWNEAHELNLIFAAIILKGKNVTSR